MSEIVKDECLDGTGAAIRFKFKWICDKIWKDYYGACYIINMTLNLRLLQLWIHNENSTIYITLHFPYYAIQIYTIYFSFRIIFIDNFWLFFMNENNEFKQIIIEFFTCYHEIWDKRRPTLSLLFMMRKMIWIYMRYNEWYNQFRLCKHLVDPTWRVDVKSKPNEYDK